MTPIFGRWVASLCLGLVTVLACSCTTVDAPRAASPSYPSVGARIVGGAAISGAVNVPGRYYFWDYQGFGLPQLLSKANGLKADASDSYVITRTDKRGKKSVLRVSADSRRRNPKSEVVKLRDGDEVYVPVRGNRETDVLPSLPAPSSAQAGKPASEVPSKNSPATPNMGLSGLAPKWMVWGQYLQRMIDTVQFQWERSILSLSDVPAAKSHVAVKFVMNDGGKIVRIVSVEGTASAIAAQACLDGITEKSPYGEWTPEMKAALGGEQEMTFTFYYQ